MKKFSFILIILGMIHANASEKWIDLSAETCNKYGKGTCYLGTSYTCGCFGSFRRAEKICHAVGGRVPSINEFQRVLKSCGATITESGTNLNKSFYKCIRAKDYGKATYWSRNKTKSRSHIWGVDFYDASRSFLSRGDHASIRCIKR